MFTRNENNNLVFNTLDFEIFIADALESTPPKNRKELEWMTKCMVDSVQLVVREYHKDNSLDEDEWEDLYLPL